MDSSSSSKVPQSKRRKLLPQDSLSNKDLQYLSSEPIFDEAAQEHQDFWAKSAFFALEAAPTSTLPDSTSSRCLNPNKRGRHSISWGPPSLGLAANSSIALQGDGDNHIDDDWLAAQFPELFPSMLEMENRMVDLDLENPFLEGSELRHPNLKQNQSLPEDGSVDGYIKFRIRLSDKDDARNRPRFQHPIFNQFPAAPRQRNYNPVIKDQILYVPPDFGKGIKLNNMDSKLMKFYLTAFCAGRTLLPKSNFWLRDIAPIADKNGYVRHAVLALSAAYVLDYKPIPAIQARANYHYKQAVDLVGQALRNPQNHEVGRDDAIIAAIIMLLSNDIVNWELRRPKVRQQRWYAGAKVAISILDTSDPGYRYYNPENVQTSNARTFNAHWVAHIDIMAQPVMPLKVESTDSNYGWLLEGTEAEVRRIHGVTGLSSKLLHYYSQITRLSARMKESPDSRILPIGARRIQERLGNFNQWSDISSGYATLEDLLNACDLDENGQVTCPAKITDLTGQAYVAAAQIYLQCRFFRRPRSHVDVKKPLNNLIRCIERMPCSGPLFTSQSPFFPVFVMGVVSYEEGDRNSARKWFDTVLLGAGCRSSVPPVWEALKELWIWMDEELEEDESDFDSPIHDRKAWWEQIVEKLINISGQLSLA